MAVGDVYEVIDVQSLYEQQVLNVYFYQQQAAFIPLAGSVAQALAEEFEATVVSQIINVQSEDLAHVEVQVRNLFDPTDTGIAVSGQIGLQSSVGGTLPGFNAFGLQLNTDNAAVRPGAKRIAGLPESETGDGIPSVAMVAALDDLADVLAAPITGGLIVMDDIMFPVVVQRVRSGTAGNYTYRLPENSGELVLGVVLEILVKLLITSQISRKVGVGI